MQVYSSLRSTVGVVVATPQPTLALRNPSLIGVLVGLGLVDITNSFGALLEELKQTRIGAVARWLPTGRNTPLPNNFPAVRIKNEGLKFREPP